MSDSLEALRLRLAQFAQARDWEQFHSPKNLSMALIAETAELVEHFQWLSDEASYRIEGEKRHEVEMEMADILIYLIRCADRLEIDLVAAANAKCSHNEARFPVDKVRGRAVRGRDVEQGPE